MSEQGIKNEFHRAGVYAGSFDPITRGHLAIILLAAKILPKLYIMVGVNPAKKPTFTDDERVEMIRHEIDAYVKPELARHNLECEIIVEKHAGLTAQFMKAHNAPVFIRGLRIAGEFDQEHAPMVVNRLEYPGSTTMFLCAEDQTIQSVSSSGAKELAKYDAQSLSHFVTPYIEEKLRERLSPKPQP